MKFKFEYTNYVLVLIVCLFFIIQHHISLGWDFAAYVLNGQYWFFNGNYFEWVRAPLVPLILGILNIFSFIGEYIFIVLVVLFHYYTCLKFSVKYRIDNYLFYPLSITPLFLIYGLSQGTELLCLAFIQLSLVYLDEAKFGVFYALAFLTRYTSIFLAPLFLIKRSFKEFFKAIGMFLIIVGVWLVYNYIMTGNFLTSIADFYALNVKFRDYIHTPIQFLQILYGGWILFLFAIIGFYKKIRKLTKIDYVLVYIFLITFVMYVLTPMKTLRYLFVMILPLVYYSCYFVKEIKFKKYVFVLPVCLMLVLFFNSSSYVEGNSLAIKSAVAHLDDNCMTASNGWVYVNYFEKQSDSAPREALFNKSINEGYRILLFYSIAEPDYVRNATFLKQFPIIHNESYYILLGDKNKCKEKYVVNSTYLASLKKTLSDMGQDIDISNCEIFFNSKIC